MSRHVLAPRNQIPIVTFRKDIGQTEGFSQLKSRLLSSLQSIDEGDLPFSKEISNLLQVSQAEGGEQKIKEYFHQLSVQEIRAFVHDISSIYDKHKSFLSDQQSFSLVVDQLRSESLTRLKSYNVTADKFISQSNDSLEDVLMFCHHWSKLEEPKRKKSVINQVVNNIGDTEKRTSVQRFKHFTKDSFIMFCNLMRHVNLYKGFHRYYVLVKFLDLFDQMTEKDVSDVCHTISHHGLHLSSDHPLSTIIKTKLMDFVEENINTIQPKSLAKICIALSPSLEYQLPREIIPRIIQFQRKIFEENIHPRFDIKVLLNISSLTNNSLITTRDGVDKDFMDVLVERILRGPVGSIESLSSKDVASLTFSVSKHRDTPTARLAVLKLLPRLRRLLADHPGQNYKNVIFAALQMAHTGLYDQPLLEQLFSCPHVSNQSETGVKIVPGLKYVSLHNSRGGFFKTGGDLLHLQGMVEVECPAYRGVRITEDLEDNLELMVGQTPLQLRSATRERDLSFLSGYYVSSQLDLYDVLCSVFGASQVCESLLVPSSGLVYYVLRLSPSGLCLPIDDTLRAASRYQVKRRPEAGSGEVWLAFFCLHPHRKMKAWARTGGLPVLQRLLGKLGFTAVWLDLQRWDSLSQQEKCDHVKYTVASHAAKF